MCLIPSQFLLKCAPASTEVQISGSAEQHADLFALCRQSALLPVPSISKLLDLLVSGLAASADSTNHDIENDEQETIHHHKQTLEAYAFLLQWTIAAVETKAAEKSNAAPARRGGKAAKPKLTTKDGVWDSAAQVQAAMDTMCRVMRLKLNRVFQTTSDRDHLYQPLHQVDLPDHGDRSQDENHASPHVLLQGSLRRCQTPWPHPRSSNVHCPEPDLLRASI